MNPLACLLRTDKKGVNKGIGNDSRADIYDENDTINHADSANVEPI